MVNSWSVHGRNEVRERSMSGLRMVEWLTSGRQAVDKWSMSSQLLVYERSVLGPVVVEWWSSRSRAVGRVGGRIRGMRAVA